MRPTTPTLPWLEAGDSFPPIAQAWGEDTPAPGLLAAGGVLSTETLLEAYSKGIFPWFSEGQPVLWWSTNPRMTLHIDEFKLHRSLRKAIRKFKETPKSEIRVDYDFQAVLNACSDSDRSGQTGTWILPAMKSAYSELHAQGHAHSVETWQDGILTGGLYFVSVGSAVFGESMFANRTDASKIALAALVGMAGSYGVRWIDCQQVTKHLAFLGARPIDRTTFSNYLLKSTPQPRIEWNFDPLYWGQLLSACKNHP